MAVDREFAKILLMCVKCCDLLLSIGCHWSYFVFPWADSGVPLGPFGQPLVRFGVPWVALGCLGDCLGLPKAIQSVFDENGRRIPSQRLSSLQLAQKSGRAGIIRGSDGSGARSAAPNPISLG